MSSRSKQRRKYGLDDVWPGKKIESPSLTLSKKKIEYDETKKRSVER